MTITQPALDQIWAATLQAATQYVGNPANLATSLMDAYDIIYGRSQDASASREEAEFEAEAHEREERRERPAEFPRTASEVQAMNS